MIQEDVMWFELWRCRSLEELRLKCAIYGIDVERWLVQEGALWYPQYEVE